MKRWLLRGLVVVAVLAVGYWLGWSTRVAVVGFEPGHLYGFVTTVATVALVGVTWRYVTLTHELVAQTKMQFQHSVEREGAAKRQEMRGLHTLCRRLLNSLATIPIKVDSAKLQGAILWDERDLHDLESLAVSLSTKEVSDAISAVNNLRWIAERVEATKDRDTPAGVAVLSVVGLAPQAEWATKLVETPGHLRNLLAASSQFLPPLDRFHG